MFPDISADRHLYLGLLQQHLKRPPDCQSGPSPIQSPQCSQLYFLKHRSHHVTPYFKSFFKRMFKLLNNAHKAFKIWSLLNTNHSLLFPSSVCHMQTTLNCRSSRLPVVFFGSGYLHMLFSLPANLSSKLFFPPYTYLLRSTDTFNNFFWVSPLLRPFFFFLTSKPFYLQDWSGTLQIGP